MPHGFDIYRVFLSAPGDLEADRQVCHQAIADGNEATAMPEKILLAAIGLRESGQIESHRAIVSDNVRWSMYFIQLFQDDWGPRDLFRKLFLLAVECRNDNAMPMRDVVVFLKDAAHESDPRILEFRKELDCFPGVRVFRYRTIEELNAQLAPILMEWAQELIAEKTAATQQA
jgi:hypothetical protein